MKESAYNIYKTVKDKRIVFNSFTCAMAEIDGEYDQSMGLVAKGTVAEATDAEQELIASMKEAGFVVDKAYDERKSLEFRNKMGKLSNNGGFGLTIAPTLSCNFACPYCYEGNLTGIMSEETQASLIEYIKRNLKHKERLDVTWYGGEPTLAMKVIQKITDGILPFLNEQQIRYSSYIVTNGYLIDEQMVKTFIDCQITGAQITIDGPPAVHNVRRCLKGEKFGGDTFMPIVHAIRRLEESGIKVTIRMNVDKSNYGALDEALALFEEYGLAGCRISLGHVTTYTQACSSISDSCFGGKEFADINLRFKKMLSDRKFYTNESYSLFEEIYPSGKGNYCCADSNSSFVVDPDGKLYKCWNDVGVADRVVGTVATNHILSTSQEMLNIDYVLWNPFAKPQCTECKVLPICMGGCPYLGVTNGNSPNCESIKYNIDNVIEETYLLKTTC